MPTDAEVARAYARVLRRSERGGSVLRGRRCLLFSGGRSGNGYRYIGVGSDVVMGAHRLVWIARHGAIPAGKIVMHHCDVPACMEDRHHRLGTKADNSADMVAKGRAGDTRGERSGKAILTESQVREIRARHAAGDGTPASLGAEYGVARETVYHVIRRRRWAHVA